MVLCHGGLHSWGHMNIQIHDKSIFICTINQGIHRFQGLDYSGTNALKIGKKHVHR